MIPFSSHKHSYSFVVLGSALLLVLVIEGVVLWSQHSFSTSVPVADHSGPQTKDEVIAMLHASSSPVSSAEIRAVVNLLDKQAVPVSPAKKAMVVRELRGY